MITYQAEQKVFYLHTKNTTYAFGFMTDFALVHLYYGKRLEEVSFSAEDYLHFIRNCSANEGDMPGKISTDTVPMEFSTFGHADLRLPTLHLTFADGISTARFVYRSHKIYAGKPALCGLPATYVESEDEADTLELVLFDTLKQVSVTLMYTAYHELDVITRSMRVKNESADPVQIERIMSVTMDQYAAGSEYDFLHLDGGWIRERSVVRNPLFYGNQEVYSHRGASSHHHNPFFALVHKKADELQGDVYGFHLVYSGNFTAGVEVDQCNTARCYLGLDPMTFGWKLEEGETFQSPEAVMVYSSEGLSGMSRHYHKLYRTRLCRGRFRDIERYALINNWEGTYFNFTEEKLLAIAKKGAEIGLDLMVLDDGWFGKRNHDRASLGDWVVNKEKLPNGLDGLAKQINDMGMKFGLWFEPEMVNPDSDLYRAHPDWVIHAPGRASSPSRQQLVLDLSREDVCDYIIDALSDILSNANIEYVKWDMNRNFSEFGSAQLPADRMKEMPHRYILGLYRIMETLVQRFPHVLWEGCASGGGRFDPGILYYMPQIWTSDCSDAGERISIQYGTSLCYPFSSMGSHVSAVPNHQTGRITSLKTRGDMATMGQFGFELDMSQMTEEELDTSKQLVARYKKYGEVFHRGDLYRLRSPFEENEAAFEFISEDQNTVILVIANRLAKARGPLYPIKLAGLEPTARYALAMDEENLLVNEKMPAGRSWRGDELMYRGLTITNRRDFQTNMLIFHKTKEM